MDRQLIVPATDRRIAERIFLPFSWQLEQSAEFQAVFRALAQIVAAQLKQDPMADAGQVMNRDMSEVQRGA